MCLLLSVLVLVPLWGNPFAKKNNCSSKTCYCVIALVMQGECVVMSEETGLHYPVPKS